MGKTMFLRLSENPTEDKKTFCCRRKTIFYVFSNVFYRLLIRDLAIKKEAQSVSRSPTSGVRVFRIS